MTVYSADPVVLPPHVRYGRRRPAASAQLWDIIVTQLRLAEQDNARDLGLLGGHLVRCNSDLAVARHARRRLGALPW